MTSTQPLGKRILSCERASDAAALAGLTGYRRSVWLELRERGFRPPPDAPCEQVTFFTSPVFPELQTAWIWVSADEQWVLAGDIAQNFFKTLGFKRGELTNWYSDAECPPLEGFCAPLDRFESQAHSRNHQLWAEASPLRGDEQVLRCALGSNVEVMRGWHSEPVRLHSRVQRRAADLLANPDEYSPALLAKVTNRYGALVALQVHLFDPVTFEPAGTGLTAPSHDLRGANVRLGSRRAPPGDRRLYLTTRLQDALYACTALGRTRLLLNAGQLRSYPLCRGADRITVVLSSDAAPDVLEAVSWLREVAMQTCQAVKTVQLE